MLHSFVLVAKDLQCLTKSSAFDVLIMQRCCTTVILPAVHLSYVPFHLLLTQFSFHVSPVLRHPYVATLKFILSKYASPFVSISAQPTAGKKSGMFNSERSNVKVFINLNRFVSNNLLAGYTIEFFLF